MSLPGERVVRVPEPLRETRGLPKRITVDNGPEFQSKALDAWAHQTGVTLQFSRPGKPVDNTFSEAFNGRMRDECLNQSWFLSLPDVRRTIFAWRELYNTGRPSGARRLHPQRLCCRMSHAGEHRPTVSLRTGPKAGLPAHVLMKPVGRHRSVRRGDQSTLRNQRKDW